MAGGSSPTSGNGGVDDAVAGLRRHATADARDALDSHLQMAWGTNRLQNLRRQSAPPELFERLKTSIKKTQNLLRRLGTFPPTEGIEFDMQCYIEEGTITVAIQKGLRHVAPRDPPPLGSYLVPEEIPASATMATINRQRSTRQAVARSGQV